MAVEEGGRVDGVGFWRVFTAGIDHELETSEDGVEGNTANDGCLAAGSRWKNCTPCELPSNPPSCCWA